MGQTQQKTRRRSRRRRRLLVAALIVVVLGAGSYSVQRWVLHNFHEVVPRQVYRSGQPGVGQVRQWTRKYGLRTIINLRHDPWREPFAEEKAAAEGLGVRLVHVPLTNHSLPRRALLVRLIEAIESSERPMLLHCRAGADRAGVGSVLAAMAIGGQDYASARRQLSVRYLHFDPFPNHVGGVFARYESYCSNRGTSTGGWTQFKDWALNVYPEDS